MGLDDIADRLDLQYSIRRDTVVSSGSLYSCRDRLNRLYTWRQSHAIDNRGLHFLFEIFTVVRNRYIVKTGVGRDQQNGEDHQRFHAGAPAFGRAIFFESFHSW